MTAYLLAGGESAGRRGAARLGAGGEPCEETQGRECGDELLPSEAARLEPALRRRELVVPYFPLVQYEVL